MFDSKNERIKKASHAVLIKNAWRAMLKIDACAAAKHKIILPWPD